MRRSDPSDGGRPTNFTQHNTPGAGGTVYANQGTGNQIIHTGPKQPRHLAGRVLLVTIVVDVAYFFYGMQAYSGRNTSGDGWRAFIFFVLLAFTGSMFRRWLRRRL